MDHFYPSKRTCECPRKAPSEIFVASYLLSLDCALVVEVMLDVFPMLMMQAYFLSKLHVIYTYCLAISLSCHQKGSDL